MNKGKNTCRILKQIRKQIADANEIDYTIEECSYKGDCTGTCPKCEQEVRYIEQQLNRRQFLGKAVVLAGLSLNINMMAAEIPTPPVSPFSNTATECQADTVKGKYQIRGIVREKEGLLTGAIIRDIETEKVAISDIDGNFTIYTDQLPVKLEVAFIGFEKKIIDVTEENYQNIDVMLEPDALIGDVVVVGAICTTKNKHIVSGTIVDENNKKIANANIYVNGTFKGHSDKKGRFKIKVNSFPLDMNIEHEGHDNIKVNVDKNNRKAILIKLK